MTFKIWCACTNATCGRKSACRLSVVSALQFKLMHMFQCKACLLSRMASVHARAGAVPATMATPRHAKFNLHLHLESSPMQQQRRHIQQNVMHQQGSTIEHALYFKCEAA